MRILDLLNENKEWLFSGAGIAIFTVVLFIVRKALQVRRNRTELSSPNEYLEKIYELYANVCEQDSILTCTSSWPIDDSRSRVILGLRAESVSFLGPIRMGKSFLGVLWRLHLFLSAGRQRFSFYHREQPGIKFVVVGNSLVLSDSRDETSSKTGKFWIEFPELARMFREEFTRLREDAVSLEEHVCDLIIQRLRPTPSHCAPLKNILGFLTGGEEGAGFPREAQLETLSRYLKTVLPRKGLLFLEPPGEPTQIMYCPHQQAESGVGGELPALRIVLTQECNFRCHYCPHYNENYPVTEQTLPVDRVSQFINVAKSMGFTHFRFTGGEPLLVLPSLLKCIRENDLGRAPYSISIATNGSLLGECHEALGAFDNLRLKISLDTLDAGRFRAITGADGQTHSTILKGLESVKGKHVVGINTVVTRTNRDEIGGLISLCSANGFYLKLMDLNWYSDLEPGSFWREHFVPLGGLCEGFRRMYSERPVARTVGGYGIPMSEYSIGKDAFIRVKDSAVGSTYSPFCRSCDLFPCQEGVYQLTLTADGKLKVCRHRQRSTSINIAQALAAGNEAEVKQALATQVDRFFRSATFHLREGQYAPP